MTRPAKLICSKDINGRKVSFFSPPHDEPDYVWVDFEELALAFLPAAKATRMVQLTQKSREGSKGITTALNGPRIAMIACHAVAQGFCMMIDHVSGQDGGRGGDRGPAFTDYCLASAEVEADYGHLTIQGYAVASENIGGPFAYGRSK